MLMNSSKIENIKETIAHLNFIIKFVTFYSIKNINIYICILKEFYLNQFDCNLYFFFLKDKNQNIAMIMDGYLEYHKTLCT